MGRLRGVGCHSLIRNEPAKRACLRCDRKFDSLGPLNRICPQCAYVVNHDKSPKERRVSFPCTRRRKLIEW